jgi:DNA polymerase-3 subunit epsilon
MVPDPYFGEHKKDFSRVLGRNDVSSTRRARGKPMDFVAIDVETANAKMSSICQIGMARYSSGVLTEEWKSYIDPEDHFDGINVSIHGIDKAKVVGAPNFKAVTGILKDYLENRVAVSHMPFDRVAISQASLKCEIIVPSCRWLDTARVARRTWKEFSHRGYGLQNVCNSIGYTYKCHDALEDAKAAANVLLTAMKLSGLDLDGWLIRAEQPVDPNSVGGRVTREGNPDGPFYGEVVVFTGSLCIPRSEAADLAAKIGCCVEAGVTKRTTLLVVGDEDIDRLAGHDKSSKHRKAEELIQSGQPIRIIQESDFTELVQLSPIRT